MVPKHRLIVAASQHCLRTGVGRWRGSHVPHCSVLLQSCMKICTYCGKVYASETMVCDIDEQPLEPAVIGEDAGGAERPVWNGFFA